MIERKSTESSDSKEKALERACMALEEACRAMDRESEALEKFSRPDRA